MEESISRLAGSYHGTRLDPDELSPRPTRPAAPRPSARRCMRSGASTRSRTPTSSSSRSAAPWARPGAFSGTGPHRAGAGALRPPDRRPAPTKRSRPSRAHDGLARVLRAGEIGGRGRASATASQVALQLEAARVVAPAPVLERAIPARPIATSSWPWRQARPKLSLIKTATRRAGELAAGARGCARAEASGSRGSRISVSASATLEASTPAFAQTKPWRVRQMSTPRSARRISADSSSTTWTARGSRSALRSATARARALARSTPPARRPRPRPSRRPCGRSRRPGRRVSGHPSAQRG